MYCFCSPCGRQREYLTFAYLKIKCNRYERGICFFNIFNALQHAASWSLQSEQNSTITSKRQFGITQSVVCWAHFPVWCSVTVLIHLWASRRGDFSLGINIGSDSQNFFRWEYKSRSSLCTHVFHHADSKDPDIYVIDGWMLATKTHPVCTIHEDGMWQPLWLD